MIDTSPVDSNSHLPHRTKFETVVGYLLNTSVLIGSVLVIAALSFEVFYDSYGVYYPLYMQIQLWVCIVFLADFFFRLYLAERKMRFLWRNLFFFLEAVLISFDKFVKHDLDECNLYHSFCGFSKEFIIDGQPSEVFQP